VLYYKAMRKKIIISLSVLFAILISGAAAAILLITNSTSQLDDVVRLHQAEHFRKNLLIKAQTVQADVYAAIHNSQTSTSIIEDIEEMNKAAAQCNSCHHSPELRKRIAGIQGLVGEYKAKLSDYIKMPADSKKLNRIEAEVSVIGGSLLKLVRDVDYQAHLRLQERVESAQKRASRAGTIFIAFLFIALVFTALGAVNLIKIITRPLDELLKATRAIGSGNLGYKISYHDGTEFEDIADNFNEMSAAIKDSYEKSQAQQKRLEESEWKFRTLFEFAHDWEYWVAEDGKMMFVSPSCEGITGYTQEEFMNAPDLRHKIVYLGDKAVWERHIKDDFRSPDTEEMEIGIVTKKGEIKWLSHICSPIFVEGKFLGRHVSNRDITDKKRLEDQVMQSQKLESIGTLAGGIAHDFNNMLTAIIGYASILKMKIKGNDALSHNVEQILASADRASNLTRSLLAFSRQQKSALQPVDLKEAIKRVEVFLTRVIGENIYLKTTITDEDLTVMADSSQIETILINLCTNARDAMPDGGALTIKAELTELDANFIGVHGYGTAGTYALISVTDTGTGMDEKTRKRIFEPFFTTKEVGKGTGLGLSMVYGVVQQHGGYVTCYSEPGIGTTFKVYLPIIESKITTATEMAETADLRGGIETILLAEDEDSVRELTKYVLEGFGYKVIPAADGEDAVNKFRENKDNIKLLLFDVVMPRMNGREAYAKIKEIRP